MGWIAWKSSALLHFPSPPAWEKGWWRYAAKFNSVYHLPMIFKIDGPWELKRIKIVQRLSAPSPSHDGLRYSLIPGLTQGL